MRNPEDIEENDVSSIYNSSLAPAKQYQDVSQINKIVWKLKDEVKPLFIFNHKYRNKDSMCSVDDGNIMTPSFWQKKEAHSEASPESSIRDRYY